MSDKLQLPCQDHLHNDSSLFLAIGAWAVIAGCLGSVVYILVSLGDLKTIIVREHIVHLPLSITDHEQGGWQ